MKRRRVTLIAGLALLGITATFAHEARPGHELSTGIGTATPARSKPPMTLATSKAATANRNVTRETRTGSGDLGCSCPRMVGVLATSP
jgi:hypothetical protein